MATLEMVEKLRQRANVTYDEAKEALGACGDDLLDAMIYLEKQGKVPRPENDGFYSSKAEGGEHEKAAEKEGKKQPRGESFAQLLGRFLRWLRNLFLKGNANSFVIWRGEESLLSMPVTVLILLALICWWVVLPLLIVGLFFGCRYRFCGKDVEHSGVNDVIASAENAANSLKNDLKDAHDSHRQQHAEDKEER